MKTFSARSTGIASTTLWLGLSLVDAQQPITPVPMKPFGDAQHAVLTEDLRYQVGNTEFIVLVPAGFVTDFASTPKAIWSVLPPTGRYQLPAIVHDFLYWDQACTRAQADDLLRVAMAEHLVERTRRDAIWDAVAKFGQDAWDLNAKEKAQGLPRIMREADLKRLPPLVSWPFYRGQLMAQGLDTSITALGPRDYCGAAKLVDLSKFK